MWNQCFGFTLVVLLTLNGIIGDEDLPCRSRETGIPGRSKLCVCDATYCDTITRVPPAPGQYVAYTSSDSGKRFEKTFGTLKLVTDTEPEDVGIEEPDQEEDEDNGKIDFEALRSNVKLRVFTNTRFQTIEGFGGAVTDAASLNWKTLSDGAQTNLIKAYYGKEGIEYNMIRTPIGGSDFSTHPYSLNDLPWNDKTLLNFSLAHEDYFYKLPMIKRAMNLATDEIKIVASTWSPPIWMKSNQKITGFSRLLPEYYQPYVDYHIRFLEEYEKADVKIWAITTTNEPINGVVPTVNFNSLGWTPSGLGRWVADNLGPTLRNSRFNATKILGVDDQRYIVPIWLAGMQREAPESIDYLDGMAIHYYGNFIPPSILSSLHNKYPGKILVATEACEGPMPWDKEKVSIGSWQRAGNYVKSILQDLNNFVSGWIDWNLCLDTNGGPNWAANYVDAPILVLKETNEFVKQPMYYGIGHFSKFIPRGSIRIRAGRLSLATVENVAVSTPEGNIVMVFQNRKTRDLNVWVRINSKFFEFQIESQSVMTIEINPNDK